MDDIECIVCYTQYNGEEYRPRILPCGHGMCTICLGTAIRQKSGKCPKCRANYVANKIEDIPINYPLETVIKQLSIPRTQPSKDLPTCTEHELLVSHRCSTHKAWLCRNCIREDHSSEPCKIIKISEELQNRKTKQLSLSKPFLDTYQESSKSAEESRKRCREVIEAHNNIVKKFKGEQETMTKKLQEEIRQKEKTKEELEKKYSTNTKKLEDLTRKKSSYDQAEAKLKSSETIKEVSQYSTDLQKEAEKLQIISGEIRTEVELMEHSFKVTGEHFLGYSKISFRDGKVHLHALQTPNIYKQFNDGKKAPLTKGILTFLDFAWPDQEPRRVYMKMLTKSNRARQHLLLSTGQRGYSYCGLSFDTVIDKGEPGEYIIIEAYDHEKAAPLLDDLDANSNNCEIKTGLVAGAEWTVNGESPNSNNGLLGIFLSDEPRETCTTGFAQVTEGLNILQDIADSEDMKSIKIIDCGVVLSW